MTISQRIFMILKEKRLKQKDLSEYTGISTSAISAWNKNNLNPAADKLSIIADFLGVSLSFLITGKEENKSVSEDISQLIRNYNAVDEISKKLIQERAETLAELAAERAAEQEKVNKTEQNDAIDKCLPLNGTCDKTYYSNASCAGTGLYLDEASAETITVRSTPEALAADFAIPISGDSMEDEYHDGDIVLVESCPCVRKGEVGIFLVDGEACIKEYDGRFLIPYNKKHDPIDLSKRESVVCFGKVIGIADVVSKKHKTHF